MIIFMVVIWCAKDIWEMCGKEIGEFLKKCVNAMRPQRHLLVEPKYSICLVVVGMTLNETCEKELTTFANNLHMRAF